MIRTIALAMKAAMRDNNVFDPEENAQDRLQLMNYILNVTV